ncbi:hypothetical protein BXY85_1730 [Roseivirga pacifica]|uniref:Uncharacterized protein n=1 Tax=Roseivirga pacifica TaxID=1267423 RepID=A0A1I0MVW3_9BACT|nr:hypothetical protein BXY85_1730 [Roseivirga pacifica]SEV92402.1 hypothetical protein SAMN05216290_0713 [Roseivirga pacifica]
MKLNITHTGFYKAGKANLCNSLNFVRLTTTPINHTYHEQENQDPLH